MGDRGLNHGSPSVAQYAHNRYHLSPHFDYILMKYHDKTSHREFGVLCFGIHVVKSIQTLEHVEIKEVSIFPKKISFYQFFFVIQDILGKYKSAGSHRLLAP